jgi:fatty-acyl-CoA synthase
MFLRRAEKLFPCKVGVVCEDLHLTYAEFGERVRRHSNALAGLGVRQGDVVAYLGHNCHRLLEAYYGVLQTGAILLPLNIRLTANDFRFILDDSGTRLMFVESQFLPAIDSIRKQLRPEVQFVVLDAPVSEGWLQERNYEELLQAASSEAFPNVLEDENDVAELFYTSGTTAQPKGVMLTHRNLFLHATSVMWALRTDDSDVQLHTIPLFHANGWGATHSITAAGGTHVMLHRFEPKRLLQLVQEEKVTTFNLVPTMATMLLQEPSINQYDLSSLRLIHMGGSAMPSALLKELKERVGCEVSCGYGLTETSPVLTVALMKAHLRESGDDFYRRAAMTGLELPGTEIRVVDDAGQDVPRDGETVGEIIVRSNIVMKGYWKQPEETARAIRDGWFYTGDMATMDSEGYILIVDRRKDIILRGGENISSIEVEKALYSHPAVMECAVIAVPDNKWGEVPKAFVVLKDGAVCEPEDLRRHCKAILAGYKVPASIKIVVSLPKGGTGKIQKKLLRAEFWQGQEKQVH